MNKISVDLTYLNEIVGGDSEMMNEMLDLFISEFPINVAAIRKAYENKDWRELGAEAHKIKPTLLYIGLASLNTIALKLEGIGKTQKGTENAASLFSELEDGIKQAIPQLIEKKKEI